ncbi:MAG: CehA/McbA family metallohydrolase [bacterium]|nr:CehA/McbA family metallohydrolase [bacterium]
MIRKILFRKVIPICCMLTVIAVLVTGCEDELSFTDRMNGSMSYDMSDGMNSYFGSLHGHSKKSDGEEWPSEVYAHARDVAGFDFYGLTDHGFMLYGTEWQTIESHRAAANIDHEFIAIRGFEWSNNTSGHINVFDTDDYTSFLRTMTLSAGLNWIDDHGGIGQFNHPGDAAWMHFSNMKYRSYAHEYMTMVEVGNGNNGVTDGRYYPYYIKALDNGWQLAPSNNLDNHSQWFDNECHRTAIVAEELTQPALLDAIRNRRVYATDDPDMEIIFRNEDGTWMGSEIDFNLFYNDSTQFYIEVTDNEEITKLELISNGGTVAAEQTYSGGETTVVWTPEIPIDGDAYYFVRVTEHNTIETSTDGDVQLSVTAPIWIKTYSSN